MTIISEDYGDGTTTNRVAIDIEAVITAATRAAVQTTYPNLSDATVDALIQEQRQDEYYRLMSAAIRPESAATILVRNSLRAVAAISQQQDAASASAIA